MLNRNEWERELSNRLISWKHKSSFNSVYIELDGEEDLIITSSKDLETLIQVLQWEKESSTLPSPIDLRDYIANDGRSIWTIVGEARHARALVESIESKG